MRGPSGLISTNFHRSSPLDAVSPIAKRRQRPPGDTYCRWDMAHTTTKVRSTRTPGLKRTRKLTPAQRDEIVAAYKQAERDDQRITCKELGMRFGVSPQRVRQILKAAGVPPVFLRHSPAPTPITAAEKRTFLRLWKAGKTANAIAEHTGRSQDAVSEFLVTEGLREPWQRCCA
jgi:hypothetical protein